MDVCLFCLSTQDRYCFDFEQMVGPHHSHYLDASGGRVRAFEVIASEISESRQAFFHITSLK
jgi:hypothetical protein